MNRAVVFSLLAGVAVFLCCAIAAGQATGVGVLAPSAIGADVSVSPSLSSGQARGGRAPSGGSLAIQANPSLANGKRFRSLSATAVGHSSSVSPIMSRVSPRAELRRRQQATPLPADKEEGKREIDQLDKEIFGASSPSLVPDEIFGRLQRLADLMVHVDYSSRPRAQKEVEQLLGYNEMLLNERCSAAGADAVISGLNGRYKNIPNIVVALENLLIQHYADCGNLIKDTASEKISEEDQRNVSELSRKFNDFIDYTLEDSESDDEQVPVGKAAASSVLGYMWHVGAFDDHDEEEAQGDPDYFGRKFAAYVGVPCRATNLALHSQVSAIRFCPDTKYLVQVDPAVANWVTILENCDFIVSALYSDIEYMFNSSRL